MQFLLRSRLFFFAIVSITAVIPKFSSAVTFKLSRTISWQNQENVTRAGITFSNYLTFNAALQTEQKKWLPYFTETIRLNTKANNITVSVQNIQFESSLIPGIIQNQQIVTTLKNFDQHYTTGKEKALDVVLFSFLPLTLNEGSNDLLLIRSFDIVVNYEPALNTTALSKKAFATTSVLAGGEWFKLAVTSTGFHKLSAAYLRSCGINIAAVDPRTIKIYGSGAGIVPQPNNVDRPDDLVENAIIVEGENDGVFNETDYVMMYGKSQFDVWKPEGNLLVREKNLYSDTTYYFLTYNQGPGKRMTKQGSQPTPLTTETTHIFAYSHEADLTNVGRTGRQFLGEAFDKNPQQSFTASIPGFISSEIIHFRSSVAARSYISRSTFTVTVNSNPIITHNLDIVGTGYESPFFFPDVTSRDFSSSSADLTVTYKFSLPPGGSNGWLDYFEINTKAALTWESNQALFRVLPAATPGNTAYEISNSVNNARYFNVTSQTAVAELLPVNTSNKSTVVNNTLAYTEIAGFNDLSTFHTPAFAGKVANQNLHSLPQADALYITPPIFYNEAMRLAAFHAQQGIKIHVVKVNDIYNEFSSGSQDISAIRDFIRMFYKRSTSQADAIKYVTFFGRASYDYKNRIANNSNFVPTYESWPSSSPGGSYCSDDYFTFLDDNEGQWEMGSDSKEILDIGIGRLPISNEREAASAVDKIINYNKPEKMGNWRNKIVFVCDDEDNNLHQTDANFMADNVINNNKNYNVEKIWIDAYKREVIAGGQRYPDAQKAINEAIQKGTFIVNYTGHGGELGWAAERILTLEDIASWTNIDHLPLFVTATCEFSRYDDPGRVSAGELTFLSSKGGAIALLSTSRLVGASENTLLNRSFYNVCGLDSTSKIAPKPLGTIMMQTKNGYGGNGNERNFTLMGDAVMTLAYPKLNVITTAINNLPLANVTDTLKALSKVTINGAVTDANGQVQTNYNGEVFPTVYDKPSIYQTLVNSIKSSPALNFVMQNNIIYKGSASVTNGLFTFSFIVPKDISYQFGKGKISYYISNQAVDGNGYNENFLVGGTADSSSGDLTGPQIQLFMNDEKFVTGGLTDQNPVFIAKLYDENGINTIGKGIGRELSLIIDNELSKAIPVNDYYEAKKDSYTEGSVKYPLKNLASGKHIATLKAWDSYNNSSESSVEFNVASNENMALQYVLNYPNPFTTNTTFHFDHNKAGENLSVMVQIYTIGGKLAKTLNTEVTAASSHFSDLKWNGLDDFGDKLGKGVYIYKVKVKTASGKSSEATQKLVILN